MSKLRQLSKEEVLFVAGETDTFYQHTASLAILDARDAPDFNFDTFRDRVIKRIEQVPNFRWKLQEVPFNLDLPYWVEDQNFDYKRHFKRIAVPAHGSREALAELTAHLYSKHLDRSKPLWEVWFIEGLPDGRFAMLQKSHHCMMDGEGASQLSEILSDLEPRAKPRAVDKSITDAKPGEVPGLWQMSVNSGMHLAGMPGRVSKTLLAFMGKNLRKQINWEKDDGHDKPKVSLASINGPIGSERDFVFCSLPLVDVMAVKQALGVSVNDVILALVSTSLRNYLSTYSELPEVSLRSSILISLRTETDDTFSNKLTSTSVTLASDMDDPLLRLQAIAEESQQVKQQARSGGAGIVEIIQLLPPLLVNAMAQLTPAEAAPQMMGANLIVSNVKSSEVPLYIAGARLESVYPMSIITQGVGINVTCVSYDGIVGVGITIDPDLVPHAWELADGMLDALIEYLTLAGKRRVKPSVAKRSRRKKVSPKKSQ